MRKVDPSAIRSDFDREIISLEAFLLESLDSEASQKNRSLLAELVFHRSYVAFESFLSAWIFGAINRNSNAYIECRITEISELVQKKFSKWDLDHINFSHPKHLHAADVRALVDRDGRNLTFGSMRELQQLCNSWLAVPYKTKLRNVRPQSLQIIDAAKSIRNCIAHQSPSSFKEMNSQLQRLGHRRNTSGLARKVNSVKNVGAYLKSKHGGKMRVEMFLSEFRLFGEQLR